MNNKKIRLCCPVCGEKNSNVKEYFYRDFTGYKNIAPFESYHVYACPECGMIYAGDIVESMPLDSYYNKMSRYEGGFVISPRVQAFYERETDFIEKYVNKNSSILDIGCAFGGLLHELQRRGFHDLEGLELSEKNAGYANKHYGLTVHIGGLGYESDIVRKYDLVILSCTLEHIIDIHQCIEEMKSFLNENGMIFIAVPAVEDFTSHPDLYQEFSTEHINYFTFQALCKLMSMSGMRLEAKTIDRHDLMGLSGNSFTLWKTGDANKENVDLHFLDAYISQCKMVENSIREKLSGVDYTNGFYIWGAGTQTAMMYQLDMFPQESVKGIVDSNKNYHGEQIYGCTIMSSMELKTLPELPILISAQYAQTAILNQIKDMGLNNEVWMV